MGRWIREPMTLRASQPVNLPPQATPCTGNGTTVSVWDVMNADVIPMRTFAGWTAFTVGLLIVAILIAASTVSGLWVFVPVFAHLYLFRPITAPKFTDAELQAWLGTT